MSLLARENEGVKRVRDFENWTVKKRKQGKNTAMKGQRTKLEKNMFRALVDVFFILVVKIG